MTETQRAAMRHALFILDSEFTSVNGEFCRWCDSRLLNERHNCTLEQTITALRAALAEPEPEPVVRVKVSSDVPGRIDELDVLKVLPRGEHLLYIASSVKFDDAGAKERYTYKGPI